jgi:hypothetical protein
MPRRTKLPPAQAKAAFVAALRRGAPVVEAAREAEVAVWSLYRWRARDPVFDAAWSFAAEASSPWAWDEGKGHQVRAAGSRRRLRFAGRRRAAFLARLERDCNTNGAARETGVNRSTVRRHLQRDAGFAGEAKAALKRGYAALNVELARQWAAAQARIRSGTSKFEIEPKGRITRDFDQQMRLLARYDRKDGTIGPRRVRRGHMRSMSFEDAIVLLDRKLRWMGARSSGPSGPSP